MADLILIPVIILLVYKISFNRDGLNSDYLSLERTNILRGIMALDVVLFHFSLDSLNVNIKFLSVCQGDDAVKVFLFLSGYGLMYQYMHKGKSYLDSFFTKRFAKIIIPFIVTAIPYIIFYKASGGYYGAGEFNVSTLFSEFFKNGYTVVYNAWYVVELMVLYIVFFVCCKLSKGNNQKMVNCCVTAVMLLMCGFWALYNYGNWMYIWFYSIYAFAMGILWAYKEKAIVKLLDKRFDYIYMLVIPLVIFIILLRRNYLIGFGVEPYIMSKNLLLGPFIVIGVIVGGMKIKVNCKVWKYLGNISYELFLIHGLFYTLLRSSLVYITNDFLYILAVLGASISSAVAIHYISKYILKAYFTLVDKLIARKKA
ncbi:MAG: acyltransferase family protein [Eubacterium sp.]